MESVVLSLFDWVNRTLKRFPQALRVALGTTSAEYGIFAFVADAQRWKHCILLELHSLHYVQVTACSCWLPYLVVHAALQ